MKDRNEWYSLFDFDSYLINAGVNFGMCPSFGVEIMEEEGDTIVFRDENGVIKRDKKETTSMPQFIEYPVKDRKSWENLKWRFDPDTPERFPRTWREIAKNLINSEALVYVGTYPFGFYGGARTLMGAEESLVACALEPELIEDINQHLCKLWFTLLSRIIEETRVDAIAFWEDMASKQGSLISPKMFQRFLTPFYRTLTELGKKNGVKVFSVDSDGLMHELTGLFFEAGVNVVYPYEVQAGNDIPYLLNKYPGICAMGGMDKRAMAEGRSAIDLEVDRIKPIIEIGRYIPFPDHLIPADVSWENYQYFVWRWKELVGKKD
jgi:uroporphyrinogen decarboxylase